MALADAESWGYQLQRVVPGDIPAGGFDVLVVDYSHDGSDEEALSPAKVDALRKRDGRPDRVVLAYLSIGEAEDYRYYWSKDWIAPSTEAAPRADAGSSRPGGDTPAGSDPPAKGANLKPLAVLSDQAPPWLAGENPEWRGNFLVRYWDKDWQSIVLGSPGAYLDKILAAGFDGVYLDKIDANDDWQKTRPAAEQEMMDFVKLIARYAREKRPGFLVVPQNAEELLENDDYVEVIDAIAKEDLLYGGGERKDGEANSEQEIAQNIVHLNKVRAAGKAVLVVEYLSDAAAITAARDRLRTLGYIPFFAKRALDEAPSVVPDVNAPAK